MFQRHTLRLWGLFELPWGFQASATYSFGSGNRFNATIPTTPFGKPGQNRLNLTATGGAATTITVPAEMDDRWDGPMTVASGDVIPRNALSRHAVSTPRPAAVEGHRPARPGQDRS